MKFKTILAAGAIAGLGTIFAFAANRPQDSEFKLADTRFEQCVKDAVLNEHPYARGGVVPAAQRAEGYRQFGDMLHYRVREFNNVSSVSVNRNDDGTVDVYAATRRGIVVLPSSIIPDVVTSFIEDRQFSSSHVAGNPAVPFHSDEASHQRVIKSVQACGPWGKAGV